MRAVLMALHAFLGVGAIGAGQALVRDPSGHTMTFKTGWLEGSPFHSYRIPGLFLVGVIAQANLASAFALGRHARGGPLVSAATGLLLVTWLTIQTAIIGVRHWTQAIWWVMFPLVAALGAIEVGEGAATRLGRRRRRPGARGVARRPATPRRSRGPR